MERKRGVLRLCATATLAVAALATAVPITGAGGEENKPQVSAAPAVGELLSDLELSGSRDNLQRRRDAARRLSEMKPLPGEAIAPLAKALGDWDRGGVQRYAGAALAGAGARAIPALAAQCNRGRDGESCQASIGVLGKIARSEPAAWPVLIDDFGSAFGPGAAVTMGRVGAPAVPLLRNALKSENPKTRAMAAKALSDIGPPAIDAVPDLLPLLSDTAGSPPTSWPSGIVCDQAALALANIDPTRTEALPVLIKIVTSERWMAAADGIKAIEKMGSRARDAAPALEQVLANPGDGLNRCIAVDALPKIEGREAAPVLVRVLKTDQDATVRFHAAHALADLGPDCPQTIPALVEALSDPQVDSAWELARLGNPGFAAMEPALKNPDLDVRKKVVNALTNVAMSAPWVTKDGEQSRLLPDQLVHLLMIAMTDKSVRIREQAARDLQFAGREPQRLALAELAREEKIYARQSKLSTRAYSREQIAASIAPDADHKYPLELAYLFPIYNESVAAHEPEFLISLHRGRERPDRLVFWKRIGEDRYRQVKLMESPEMVLSEGRFRIPQAFHATVFASGQGPGSNDVERFVDVPQTACNTWCVVDNVFAIHDGDFIPVAIESPEKWYKPRLRRGESTWHSNANSFSDDKLSFAFSIWAGEDPHASPSAGEVSGTYKIIRETGAPSARAAAAKPVTGWKMVVENAERNPIQRR